MVIDLDYRFCEPSRIWPASYQKMLRLPQHEKGESGEESLLSGLSGSGSGGPVHNGVDSRLPSSEKLYIERLAGGIF